MQGRGNFRVSVTKDYLVFASAHFITFAGHRCEGLHGHNYRARVTVEGALNQESWFVFDFVELKRIMRVNRTFFDKIKDSKSISLDKDEYDVFGDGKVVLKAAPGHSPGHQVLVLNLAKTGRVMVAGDLYHYPQERTLHRPPPDTEFNVQQSAASRVMIEEYLKRTKTEIWIEHDFVANAKLKKAPAFYD